MRSDHCAVTHLQIRQGRCPSCRELLGDAARTGDDSVGPHDATWNANVMLADLASDVVEIRRITARNLRWTTFPMSELLPLLSSVMVDKDEEVNSYGLDLLSTVTVREREASWLEEQTQTASCELAARALLLGYYFRLRCARAETAKPRRTHICAVIKQAPSSSLSGSPYCLLLEREDRVGYHMARAAWQNACALYENQVRVVSNAAAFFLLSEPALAEKLLQHAQSLEPENAEWHRRLAQLYSLASRSKSRGDRYSLAEKAYAELCDAERLEAAGDGKTPHPELALLSRIELLQHLARGAFDAGKLDAARSHAEELLRLTESEAISEYFRHNGNAIHYGHLVLGRVAFQRGDIEDAKLHLLASAQSKGSPNLNSFGPNMSLAKDLLKAGEREAVLSYFELCGQFWKCGQDRLTLWKSDIESGRIPLFGANLVY
jgi:hypothetical protein